MTAPAPQLDRYETIVIDPPWPGPGSSAAFKQHKRLRILLPYRTMTGIQVATLGVPQLASPRAQLWIWATSRSLADAQLLQQSWGFDYRALFVWLKPLGTGRHVRNQCEFLLWGARTGARLCDVTKCPHQVHRWPRRGHSEKPAEAYELIAQLSDGPRLDIFARQQRPGFEAWGNEAVERLEPAAAR